MKTSFTEDLIATFIATVMTFAAIQIALPDSLNLPTNSDTNESLHASL